MIILAIVAVIALDHTVAYAKKVTSFDYNKTRFFESFIGYDSTGQEMAGLCNAYVVGYKDTEEGLLIYADDLHTEEHEILTFIIPGPDKGKQTRELFESGMLYFEAGMQVVYSLSKDSQYYYEEGMPYPVRAFWPMD